MILSLMMSFNTAWACKPADLKPLILVPTKNYQVEVDRHQEVILDGSGELPKIKAIKGSSPKGKPMLTVMSGLQMLENGNMKSYPHRISVKMNEMEKDWERPVEINIENQGKPYTVAIQWKQSQGGCFKAVTK